MTAGLGDYSVALSFRDVIQRLVLSEVEKVRPQYRYAEVWDIATDNKTCRVVFAGEGDSDPVTVRMGSVRPTSQGQLVRVGGLRGDRFIDEVVSGGVNFEIASRSIKEHQIDDSQIIGRHFADGSIAGSKLSDLAVTALKIADLAVVTSKYADLSITSQKLADLAVTTAKLADLGVTTAKLADLGVTTAKLADLGVTTAKLADLAVTTAKLASGAVTTAKLAIDAVDTAAIQNLAITSGKIASSAVTNAKLATDSVSSIKIQARAVTENEQTNTAPFCITQRTSTFSVPNTTDIAIPMSQSAFNVQSMWSSATPSRITFPRAGFYQCIGSLRWAASATAGEKYCAIVRNGGISASRFGHAGNVISTNAIFAQSVTALVDANAGDYVELYAYQSTGAATNLVSDFGAFRFGAFWVMDK